jgi:MFS family permease
MSAATRHQVAPRADVAYEWKAVSLLSIAFGLVGLDRWIIAPMAPAIFADLNLRPQDINNLVAILGVTWGISALLTGPVAAEAALPGMRRRWIQMPSRMVLPSENAGDNGTGMLL